jgi:hypothetical protein
LHHGAVVAQGTAGELAGQAGENRFRLTLPAAQESSARAVLHAADLGPFTNGLAPEEGWISLEGAIPGGTKACAEVTTRLFGAGVALGGLTRVPLSLADMIERLVNRRAA